MYHNRFTIIRLPVGYGKTIISMLVAIALAKKNGGVLQLAVIAPKSKRLDNSFVEAIDSAEKHYNVKLKILPINNQVIGTFAGLNRVKKDRQAFTEFERELISIPTMIILDETHMRLREPTKTASKTFMKLYKFAQENHSFLRVVGLTATPFDTSILDAIGYSIMDGQYTTRTNFYRREVVGYGDAFKRGLTQKDIEQMIVDTNYKIHKEMFYDIIRVVNNFRQFIYSPNVPKTFHIPKNKMHRTLVNLSEHGLSELEWVEKLDRQKAFSDAATKQTEYVKAITTDSSMMQAVIDLTNGQYVKQPLIFYQYNPTLEALKEAFDKQGLGYLEVNGHHQSYFTNHNSKDAVFVQYFSGATAFESKSSNLSIYVDLPSSSINFEQSLGRNARRGQDVDIVHNYVLAPQKKPNEPVKFFKKQYNRIVNKSIWNAKFLKAFETQWGAWEYKSKKTR